MDAETFKKAVHPLLKAQGFTKSGATWRKRQEESIAVFNVQKSQWGGGTYYVNVGTHFLKLGEDPSPTHNKCHVQRRLELAEPEVVVESALQWFRDRAALQSAAALAESDSKKGLVFKELRRRQAAGSPAGGNHER